MFKKIEDKNEILFSKIIQKRADFTSVRASSKNFSQDLKILGLSNGLFTITSEGSRGLNGEM